MANNNLIASIEEIEAEAKALLDAAQEAARERVEAARREANQRQSEFSSELQKQRSDLRQTLEREQAEEQRSNIETFKTSTREDYRRWLAQVPAAVDYVVERSRDVRGNR
ncbi:MAG: hypothetical protein Q4P72_01955 [Eubacteriales bacterium]|nr:hypothetical protein [Eubacteriales bacterium]